VALNLTQNIQMEKPEHKRLNIKQHFTDVDMYEKYRLAIVELLFAEGKWTRDKFQIALEKILPGDDPYVYEGID